MRESHFEFDDSRLLDLDSLTDRIECVANEILVSIADKSFAAIFDGDVIMPYSLCLYGVAS